MSLLNDIPTDFRVLFLDMDAFFASCEQQVNPSLRGRPVGITPQIVDSGCVIASSYEAKQRGVKTGCLVAEAKRICPEIVLVEANPPLYKQIHRQIVNILNRQNPWVNPKSIDEFSLKLPPSEQDFFKCKELAYKIKKEIKNRVGGWLTASIGLGPNQFLAKVAGEMEKPNGLTFITLEEIEPKLSKLELTDLPGIAAGLSRRLRAEGIHSISQLLATDAQVLRRIFGFNGQLWWYRLRGYEVDDVEWTRATIGHSHVLAPEWRTPDKAKHVLNRLVHKVGQRLRHEGYWARYTALGIAYVKNGYYFNHLTTLPYSDSGTMMNLANRLFDMQSQPHEYIMQLAFHVSELVEGKVWPEPLFPEMQKSLRLTQALDAVNDKFGRDTIFAASMMEALETAPDRIPFGKVRY